MSDAEPKDDAPLRRDGPGPLLMGVLNLTPDSFYDGGRYNRTEEAVKRGCRMAGAGADLLDLGGESTRPGAEPVSLEEERRRVLPVLRTLSDRVSIPLSIDSSKPELVDEALEAGASLVNDVTAGEDPKLLERVAEAGVPIVLMHMQGVPRTMQENPQYEDAFEDVRSWLMQRVEMVCQHGIQRNRIIVDPGIGFGKTLVHNRELMRNAHRLGDTGQPVLVGHSRKSFLRDLLDRPADDRLAGTLAVSSYLMRTGVDVLRVHDVREHADLRRTLAWIGDLEGREKLP